MFRLYRPQFYQGPLNFQHRKGYFEGWYYKFVSPGEESFAVIPGISLNPAGSFAFIQTIAGGDGKTSYNTFPLSEVRFGRKSFSISIGGNYFSLDEVVLGDRIPVSGKIRIRDIRPYKVTLLRPGIMGWYRYVPGMECYHGMVSSGHSLEGELAGDSFRIRFDRGRGYIEKDWGTSFPESYIWMQSNNFPDPDNSFMLSVAKIPWFGASFRGFLGFLDLGDRRITFSTYTGSRLSILSHGENQADISISGRRHPGRRSLKKGEAVHIRASRRAVGELMAPRSGSMDRRIGESIDAEITVQLVCGDQILFQGTAKNSGLEMVGDIRELTTG